VLLNTMVPISLVVSIELSRLAQCRFLAWDEQMASDGSGTTPARPALIKYCLPRDRTV
jgi:magnesium-transporting ATPase (P-type)